MGTNEVIRKKLQSGTEGTRGTAVAATRIIYAEFNHAYDRPTQDFPDRSGTYFGRRRIAYTRPAISFSGTDLLTYEDLPYWMELGVKGGVTAAADGGTPIAYTRAYIPSGAVDDLKSWTIEFNEPGNVYKTSQFMLNSWTIRVDPDNNGAWMFDFEGVGRDWTSSSYTGSIADRVTEAIRAPGTLAWLDSATIGTTALTGKVIDFSLACNLNLHMKAFLENDGDWAQGRTGRGIRTFDATCTMEFDGDTEFANYRATVPVQRKMRIQRTGSQIHGSSIVNKTATIDVYGYWRSIGFGDREGNLTATFGLQAFYDATATTDASVTVINGISGAAFV